MPNTPIIGSIPSSPISTSRFRHRKISVKQRLSIYRPNDIKRLIAQQSDDDDFAQGGATPTAVSPAQPTTPTPITGPVPVADTFEPSPQQQQQQQQINTDVPTPPYLPQDIETGVEKSEEQEVHLRRILLSSLAAASKHSIPVPEVVRLSDKVSKREYRRNYRRFWRGELYGGDSDYIKFSATVEDCCGGGLFSYVMDEVDEEFLKVVNSGAARIRGKGDKDKGLSEDEFEFMCTAFEAAIKERQPFLTMDPESILGFEEVKLCLERLDFGDKALREELAKEVYIGSSAEGTGKQLEAFFETKYDYYQYRQYNGKQFRCRPLMLLLELYGPQVYEHWKQRKIKVRGGEIFPQLKFERPGEREEVDPYVCFRRRELRQPRKTRKVDTVNCQKLRALRTELKHARELATLVARREYAALRSFENDVAIFDARCRLRELKRTLNINLKNDKLLSVSGAASKLGRAPVLTLEKKEQLLEEERQEAIATAVVERENLKVRLKLKLDLGRNKNQQTLVSHNAMKPVEVPETGSHDTLLALSSSERPTVDGTGEEGEEEEEVAKGQQMEQLQRLKEGYGQTFGGTDGKQVDGQLQMDQSTRSQRQQQEESGSVVQEGEESGVSHLQSLSQQQKEREKQKQLRSQQSRKDEFSQVYVKLPSSKIPELVQQNIGDLLREKKRVAMEFVREKMAKRRRDDDRKGFLNLGDNPYSPILDMRIPSEREVPYPERAPFSSVLSPHFEVRRLYNFPGVDRYLNLGANRGKGNGNRDTNETVTHLNTSIPPDVNVYDEKGNKINGKPGFQPIQFYSPFSSNREIYSREYPFLFRRRSGRCGLEYLDYRRNPTAPFPPLPTANNCDPIENVPLTVKHANSSLLAEFVDFDAIESEEADPDRVIDVYSSRADELSRLYYRWKHDASSPYSGLTTSTPFSSEPARLNRLPDATQAIRFGAVIGGKTYERLRKATLKYRWEYLNMVKLRKYNIQRQMQKQMQRQQQQQQQQQQRQKQKQKQKQGVGPSQMQPGNGIAVQGNGTNGGKADTRYKRTVSEPTSPSSSAKRIKRDSTSTATPTPVNSAPAVSPIPVTRTPLINHQPPRRNSQSSDPSKVGLQVGLSTSPPMSPP